MLPGFRILIFCMLLSSWVAVSHADSRVAQVKLSVVKVHTTIARPDYFSPWQLSIPQHSTASGTVISGQRILTNAHVIANAKYIQVQKHNDPDKFIAEVIFVSHDADLAILKVKDRNFFKDLKPLELGTLPKPHQEVSVFGYPVGGETLSITKGVMSRVEQQFYSHANSYLLAGQIDAAINPGNSGGPVIVGNRIAGIVMQTMSTGIATNVGYFVPPSIIRHVLKDSEDGVNDGFPELGFRTQALENPSAKAAYGLDNSKNGILVIKVFKDSAAFGKLQKNDVIVKIDGHDIAGNQTINFSDTQRSDYKHAIDLHHVGEPIEITYVRAGKTYKTTLIGQGSKKRYQLVEGKMFDQIPRYYIYGGVVFVPLDMNLVNAWGASWMNSAPPKFLYAQSQWTTPEIQERVVALQVMAADVNLGYHNFNSWIIDSINGQSIRDFAQFCKLLKNNREKYVVFEDDQGFQLILEHKKALESEKEILEMYSIPASYSAGLFDGEQKAGDRKPKTGNRKQETKASRSEG